MSTIKRVFLSFFCVLIVLSSFIFPVFAQTYTLNFNIPNPAGSSDGYIIVPYVSNNNVYAYLYFWEITPIYGNIDNTRPKINVDINSNTLKLDFGVTDQDSGAYLITLYRLHNGLYSDTEISVNSRLCTYQNFYNFQSNLPNGANFLTPNAFDGISQSNFDVSLKFYSIDYTFTDNSAFFNQLKEINTNLVNLISKSQSTYEELNILTGIVDNINFKFTDLLNRVDITNEQLIANFNELVKITNHFISLLEKVDLTNSQLATLLEQFQFLLDSVYNIEYTLDQFVFYYWEQFANYDMPNHISAITSRLDGILRALNKSGDSEQTTADTSNIDNYVDIEQSLVHNDEAQSAINDMDVSITGKAYSFIWNLITRILNSHAEVFGLVIAILTLGFIALLLNR